MKIRKRPKFHSEVSTSSLNDIMFFLLLFFLIISTVANPNVIKLMLPKAQTTQALSKQQISISITKDKQYYINKTLVEKENLEAELLKAIQGLNSPTVIVRAENELLVQDLVDVLQIGLKLKIKMVLAVQK
jgi:biopolymer transport protein ExbD